MVWFKTCIQLFHILKLQLVLTLMNKSWIVTLRSLRYAAVYKASHSICLYSQEPNANSYWCRAEYSETIKLKTGRSTNLCLMKCKHPQSPVVAAVCILQKKKTLCILFVIPRVQLQNSKNLCFY